MALVPALINVTWNANYLGHHRVCWSTDGGATYTCTVDPPGVPAHPSCTGAGLACGYDIDIMVDNETCDTVVYDGYIQPACEAEGSLVARIPFSVSFIPSPACKMYEVVCAETSVDVITVINGGNGYVGVPAVSILGGGGMGATAIATLTADVVTSIAVVSPGSNYTSIPTVLVAAPPAGVTATAVAVMDNCPLITYEDCVDSAAHSITAGLPFLDSVKMCSSDGTPSVPAGYSIAEDVGSTCLCDCTTMTISNTGPSGTVDIIYIQCQDAINSETTSIAAGASVGPICVVTGSLTYVETGAGVYSEVIGAACDGV